jgi:hypothetical protein
MNETNVQGTFQFQVAQDYLLSSSTEAMDQAVDVLRAHKDAWAVVSVADRIALIDQLVHDFAAVMPRLREAEQQAKGVPDSDIGYTQETFIAYIVIRNLQSLKRALTGIQATGRPRIPGRVTTLPNGQAAAQVFPETIYDRAIFQGYTIEVRMEPGIKQADIPTTQASAYQDKNRTGKVALVLGAGNVNAIPFTDVLYKLFVENQVVLLKMNPVNAHTGPIFEEGFRPLVEKGFLRLAYGGPAQGNYLCNHPGVDVIHLTGSDKTFEAIVFGPGPEGARRKAERTPLIDKPITGELGCITPIIIVPGPWTPAEMDYQADKLASWLGNNTGFTCNTPHLLLTQAEWPLRQQFLGILRQKLALLPVQKAYYPGSKAVYQRFMDAHPEAERFGNPQEDQLPWTLIASIPNDLPNEICFQNEPFCGLLSETPLQARTVAEFIEGAVDFANQRVWGTLDVALFVHPASLKEPEIAAAVDRAVDQLRYGTVSINIQAMLAYAFSVAPWGSYPGQDFNNIQSGIGWVHNTLMFASPQKVVLRGPFMEFPKSPLLISRIKIGRRTAPLLFDLEVKPSLGKLLRLIKAALA